MITIIKKGLDTCFFSDGIQLARAVGKEGWLDSFEEKAPGVYRWIRRLPASDAGNKGTGKMRMELRASYLPDFTMVPGVNYDGNGWEPSVSIPLTAITAFPGPMAGTVPP